MKKVIWVIALFVMIASMSVIGIKIFAATTAHDPVVVEQSVLNKDWNFRDGVWIDNGMVLGLEGQSGDTYLIRDTVNSTLDMVVDGTERLSVGATNTFTGDMSFGAVTITGNITANDAGADTILIGSATDTVRIYGILTLGDNGATGEVNTSDWDISETGVMTGIGAITMDGLLTGTAGATITGAAVNLNASSNFATNINTGTTTAAVAIGGGSGTVAVNSSDWDISTAGAMTNIDSVDNAGTLAISTSASGGNVTVTTNDATGTVSVLTGNLKVGNGSPGVTQDGEDAYIEGTFEVDGASQFDGAVVATSTFSQTGTGTFGTGTGAVSLNGTTTVATGKTLNSVDNAGITANGKPVIVSHLAAAQAIYSDIVTLASGELAITFGTAFSAAPHVTVAAIASAEAIYCSVASTTTGVTLKSVTSPTTSTAQVYYIAVGAR